MEPTVDDQKRASTYTIQSDGAKVLRFHLYDWLILLILVAIEALLQRVPPYQRHVSKSSMNYDLNFPYRVHSTVPFWSVPLVAVLLPVIIFAIFYIQWRNVYDFHNATLALLYAVAVTAVITDSVKNAVGRPRPDYYWRCFPDGKPKYDSHLGNAVCHGAANVIMEGHRSFPSGHSSISFAGLGFLSLYLCGKMRVFDHNGHVAKLCVATFPLLVATAVAVSRVHDYWHHWQDVLVGGLLGLIVAFFSYHQFFPSPNHPNGREPYACLEEMLNVVHKKNGKEGGEEEGNDELTHVRSGDDDAVPKPSDSSAHGSNNSQIRNRRRHETGDAEIQEADLEAQQQ